MRHILATSLMLSSMLIPAVAHATSSTDDATAPTPGLRVSTGVIAPSLVGPLSIQLPENFSASYGSMDTQVGLSLTVDSNGLPQNIKVVKSSNPFIDARIVDAIQKSHFRPGSMDETAIPIEMNLTVSVAH